VRHHFYFYLFGLFRSFRIVRKMVVPKIGASGDYLKFIARANTNSETRCAFTHFIPGTLIETRQLKCRGKIICIARCLRKIVREIMTQFIPSAHCFDDEIANTTTDLVSANFSRIPQSKLPKTKSVLFGSSFLAGSESSDISN